MNTKKHHLIIASVAAGLLFFASSAMASSFQFSPATVNTTTSSTFTVNVSLNPEGVKNYVSKMQLTFPADLVSVNSFTFDGNWIPVPSTDYNLIDNTNGILIKAAGFPAGTASPVNFGTISFTAKKAGSGQIAINGNSFSFDASQHNILNPASAPLVLLSVQNSPAPASTTTRTTTTTPSGTTSAGSETINPESTPVTSTTPAESTTPTNTVNNGGPASLLSAMNNIFSLGTGQTWIAILVLLVILGAGWWTIDYFSKRNKTKAIIK